MLKPEQTIEEMLKDLAIVSEQLRKMAEVQIALAQNVAYTIVQFQRFAETWKNKK